MILFCILYSFSHYCVLANKAKRALIKSLICTTQGMSAAAHLVFRDEAQNVQVQHSTHFRITDGKTKITYSAANAQHGCQIIAALIARPVSKSMFYCLASKTGSRAGALRHRFTVTKC